MRRKDGIYYDMWMKQLRDDEMTRIEAAKVKSKDTTTSPIPPQSFVSLPMPGSRIRNEDDASDAEVDTAAPDRQRPGTDLTPPTFIIDAAPKSFPEAITPPSFDAKPPTAGIQDQDINTDTIIQVDTDFSVPPFTTKLGAEKDDSNTTKRKPDKRRQRK